MYRIYKKKNLCFVCSFVCLSVREPRRNLKRKFFFIKSFNCIFGLCQVQIYLHNKREILLNLSRVYASFIYITLRYDNNNNNQPTDKSRLFVVCMLRLQLKFKIKMFFSSYNIIIITRTMTCQKTKKIFFTRIYIMDLLTRRLRLIIKFFYYFPLLRFF